MSTLRTRVRVAIGCLRDEAIAFNLEVRGPCLIHNHPEGPMERRHLYVAHCALHPQDDLERAEISGALV